MSLTTAHGRDYDVPALTRASHIVESVIQARVAANVTANISEPHSDADDEIEIGCAEKCTNA